MAVTVIDDSGGQSKSQPESQSGGQGEEPVRKRRFVASSSSSPATQAAGSTQSTEPAGPLMSGRAAIAGVGIGAAALLCAVLGAGLDTGLGTGLSGGEVSVGSAEAQKMSDLREQIRVAQTRADALPEARDAERGLVMAQSAAEQVAALQNQYRHLTPAVAAAGGRLDAASSEATRRNLIPYFSPDVGRSALEPWYLLASDKDVPAGNGIPMSFDSGVEWVAQRPYWIEVDSTIPLTWLAVETRSTTGQEPVVLAWARADYDMTRKTFSQTETGTTTKGEAQRQAVTAP